MKVLQNRDFSSMKIFKDAWEFVVKNFWFLIGVTSLYLFLVILLERSEQILSFNTHPAIHYLLVIIGKCWMDIYIVKMYLNIIDNKSILKDLKLSSRLIVHYVCASLLYTVIAILGLMLLVFPGIIWSIKYIFYPYFIIDKGLGPIEALKASAKLTDGVKWRLSVFSSVSLLVFLLGILCFGIGVLIAVPLVGLAWALTYRRLISEITKN